MARSYGLVAACFALLVAAADATQFRVGGRRGWSVPDASVEPYNAWAGRMRFQRGDQLLFVYAKETDSVLVVEQSAYDACNTSSWIKKFDDGSTVVTLDRSGPFFFVSGNEASCRAGEKLIVVVLADRSGRAPPAVPSVPPSISTPPSAAPAPSPFASPPSAAPMPAPAATPSSVPSPAASAPVPAPMGTPSSAPSPAASAPVPAPMATPSSPPSPAALAPTPSSSPATPGGAAQPPSASGNAPGAEGSNSTTPASPSANGRSGAAPVVAGFATSLGAYIAYAVLVI